MSPNPKEDDLLTRYLLGDSLADQEESLAEHLLFERDEYLEHAGILEDEIIESHLKGELTANYETLFQKRLNISPRLRERVTWIEIHMTSFFSSGSDAQVLGNVFGGPQTAVSWWESAQRAWQRRKVAASLVTVLLLIATGLWILAERIGSHALKRSLIEQRQTNLELARQLEKEMAKRESLDRELAQFHAGSQLTMASLLLTPADAVQTGQRRGEGGAAVELAQQAAVLQLQMIPRSATYMKYRGVIETVEGEEIVTQNDLTADNVNGKGRVVWQLSTQRLPTGDYIVSLYGVASNGKRSLAGVFSFHLRKISP